MSIKDSLAQSVGRDDAWLARHDASIRAEALKDAAADKMLDNAMNMSSKAVREWLVNRAKALRQKKP